ncbi:MAG: hypothetical protein ACRCSB_00535 [Bacteroidales bacterium]
MQISHSAEKINNHLKFALHGFEWEWLSKFKIALVGLRKIGAPNSFSTLRETLYSLYSPAKTPAFIDLGDIEISTKSNNEKIIFALQKTLLQGVLPIVICENMHASILVYEALKSLEKKNATSFILPHANLGDATQPLSDTSILAHLMCDYERELETLNVIGYQNYLTSSSDVQELQSRYCELLRLSAIRDNPFLAEPLLRQSHMTALSLNAIRGSDAPATYHPQPNGLYAEEACRLMRISALSNQLRATYIGGFSLSTDVHGITASLLAQIIWHIIEGQVLKVEESPNKENSCRKIQVQVGRGQKIVFYQGKITQRWWMEIPITQSSTTYLLPCLSDDYTQAAHGEIPLRWLWHYKKMDNKE